MSEPSGETLSEKIPVDESFKSSQSGGSTKTNVEDAPPRMSDSSPQGSSKRLAKKNKGTEVFVGDVSFFCTDLDLLNLFSEHGRVLRTRIKRSDKDGRTLMYGFVDMENYSEAEQAMEALNGSLFQGRNIRVELSGSQRTSTSSVHEQSHQIFVAFSSDETNTQGQILPTESLLREIIEQHVPVKDVAIKEYHCDETTRRQQGFCFAAFHSLENAKSAFSFLHDKHSNGFEFHCSLSFHRPLADNEFNREVQQRAHQRRRSVPLAHSPHSHHFPVGYSPTTHTHHTTSPHNMLSSPTVSHMHSSAAQTAMYPHAFPRSRSLSDEAMARSHSQPSHTTHTSPSHTPHNAHTHNAHTQHTLGNAGFFPLYSVPMLSMMAPPHTMFAAPPTAPLASPTQSPHNTFPPHNAFPVAPHNAPTQPHHYFTPSPTTVFEPLPPHTTLSHNPHSPHHTHTAPATQAYYSGAPPHTAPADNRAFLVHPQSRNIPYYAGSSQVSPQLHTHHRSLSAPALVSSHGSHNAVSQGLPFGSYSSGGGGAQGYPSQSVHRGPQ